MLLRSGGFNALVLKSSLRVFAFDAESHEEEDETPEVFNDILRFTRSLNDRELLPEENAQVQIHRKAITEAWNLDEFRLVVKTKWDKLRSSETVSDQMKAKWSDPAWRERTLESMRDPANRQKMSEFTTALWSTPEYREKQSVASAKRWAKPSEHQKLSEAVKTLYENLDIRPIKRRDGTIVMWDPARRRQEASENFTARWADPDSRQKLLDDQAAAWANPEKRQELSKTMSDLYAKQRQAAPPKTGWQCYGGEACNYRNPCKKHLASHFKRTHGNQVWNYKTPVWIRVEGDESVYKQDPDS